jgi:transposase
MAMGNKRRDFTPEYKAEAVRTLRGSGKPLAQVARELGLVESVLHRWNKVHKQAEEVGSKVSRIKAEREELQRLRRENEQLRQERDFLKSAAAYFAKERK